MIGQETIVKKLNKYNLNDLPRTILLIGEKGAGKHLLVSETAKRLQVPVVEIKNDIEAEQLIEYQQNPISTIYVINLAEFIEKQQNKLLKFIEEPSSTVYIMLLAESEVGVLDTILNRCLKMYFEQYTELQLRTFTWLDTETDELVYKICTTPGQIQEVDNKSLKALYDLCQAIISRISTTSYNNAAAIASKINYVENYTSKFSYDLFFKMLSYCAKEDYIKNNNELSLKIYKCTNEFRQNMVNKALIKENFVLNFLTNLWCTVRG